MYGGNPDRAIALDHVGIHSLDVADDEAHAETSFCSTRLV
jgi:hypothetical protein